MLLGDQHARAGLEQLMGDAGRRVLVVERHVGAAGLEDRQQRDDHRGRALHAQPDPLRRTPPSCCEMIGESVGGRVELCVGQRFRCADHGGPIRRQPRLLLEALVNGRPGSRRPRCRRLTPTAAAAARPRRGSPAAQPATTGRRARCAEAVAKRPASSVASSSAKASGLYTSSPVRSLSPPEERKRKPCHAGSGPEREEPARGCAQRAHSLKRASGRGLLGDGGEVLAAAVVLPAHGERA